MNEQCVIILAAGKGTRMKSSLPKVMCEILFEPMIKLVLNACKKFQIQNKYIVINKTSLELMKNYIGKNAKLTIQNEQKGTAHAVLCAKEFLQKNLQKDVFICYGDSPFIDENTIQNAFKLHKKENACATLITSELENSFGYGRIVKNSNNNLIKIVEEKDANLTEKKIKEVNSGAYWFKIESLLKVITKINNNNCNKEFYLTDAIELLINDKQKVKIFKTKNSDFCLNANNKEQLFQLNEILRNKVINKLMSNGVEFLNLNGILISPSVKIKPGTKILPGTILKQNTTIGENCIIGPNTIIENSSIGNNCSINSSQIYKSKIENFVKIGPFCHIRPNSKILSYTKIGNFVEIKNSTLGEGTSVAHLTYVGDSDVGKNVNFGCGVVTTNFDGINKNRCEIQDGAFLGCNTNLIAPIKIGKNAYTGAGSTITKNVPENALAIERAQQINLKDYSKTKLADRKLKFKN